MKPSQETSVSLLQRVRGHDQAAWQRLVALYGPLVHAWCQAGGARGSDADDVAQEVFLAVALGLERFQGGRTGSFRSWVRSITRHKLVDYQRRRSRQPAEAAGGSDALTQLHEVADPAAGSAEDAAEIGSLYRRALDLIRAEFEGRTWQAFWDAAVEGRDTAAVAAALGMSPVAVRIAKSRVLGRLRDEVDDLIQ
jgi:RNA polymerase sigma-70 factor (ECF subfamily)